MPTRTFYRLWCKGCTDWTLHRMEWDNNYKCKDCNLIHKKTLLADIPLEKAREQRERYKIFQKEQFSSMISLGMSGMSTNPLQEILSEDWPKDEIIESDAGQKYLDQKVAERKQGEIEARLKELENYRHVGRNEICPCGSGLKFKKCHLLKINNHA